MIVKKIIKEGTLVPSLIIFFKSQQQDILYSFEYSEFGTFMFFAIL